jgi:hypothetical protein
MTSANLKPPPELGVIGVLQLRPCSEQTAPDLLDDRQIIRLDGHRVSNGRIIRIVDHHQLLGRKVPEERHLRDPSCGGDIGDGRLVVAAIGEQPQSLPLQACPRSR